MPETVQSYISSPNKYKIGSLIVSPADDSATLFGKLVEQAAKIKELQSQIIKLEAAVDHRDHVIAQLASSRKLVFEECHRACIVNQTELNQMQDALHRVSRQLQRERREHAARIKELCPSGKLYYKETQRDSNQNQKVHDVPESDQPLPWDSHDSVAEGIDAPGTPTTSSIAELVSKSSPHWDSIDSDVDFLSW